MELDFHGKEIVSACIREGMLINCTMDTVLRFMPPLIVTEEEIDLLIGRLTGSSRSADLRSSSESIALADSGPFSIRHRKSTLAIHQR